MKCGVGTGIPVKCELGIRDLTTDMVKEAAQALKASKYPALNDDVKKFAAKLGFGTAAGGDNAFDDFAPEKAKKRIVQSKPSAKDATKVKKKSGDDGIGKGKSKKRDDANDDVAHGDAEDDGADAAGTTKVKGRDWNFGVGPRPGEPAVTTCGPVNLPCLGIKIIPISIFIAMSIP